MDVWVVTITHQFGENCSVHASALGAQHELYSFVESWWSDLNIHETIPADKQEAINMYFEYVGDEYYSLTQTTVVP